ncbi:hypothetical protein PS655_05077 [Pseudomonas fluorescens]|uniref:Uncharacterized protein n=1 Tax=Pseudomonas fluorescens TaxID=294 RepID=A0A5E6X158_PSEFL|nr:hypothetical protein PS655_05077 [Pseudomonas fluorescens]
MSFVTQVKAPQNVSTADHRIFNNCMERHLEVLSLRIKIDNERTVLGYSLFNVMA